MEGGSFEEEDLARADRINLNDAAFERMWYATYGPSDSFRNDIQPVGQNSAPTPPQAPAFQQRPLYLGGVRVIYQASAAVPVGQPGGSARIVVAHAVVSDTIPNTCLSDVVRQ
ncbi:hypothetical protein AURDEDRAFT_177591 [Auricularia subglabra TFB-10046 SS5]|uniref:Uncharacterized protein n=1 Tax=Auricularia subglabra (strain TFB-10046 / SS5) TaxID=717982 RepID=J0D3S1_AURST|nr:hypothetical protein AURDEDRAFT_177591 [Auricularia subglabra TFB-10046 SS5]